MTKDTGCVHVQRTIAVGLYVELITVSILYTYNIDLAQLPQPDPITTLFGRALASVDHHTHHPSHD